MRVPRRLVMSHRCLHLPYPKWQSHLEQSLSTVLAGGLDCTWLCFTTALRNALPKFPSLCQRGLDLLKQMKLCPEAAHQPSCKVAEPVLSMEVNHMANSGGRFTNRLTRTGFKHKQRWLRSVQHQAREDLCKVRKQCKSSNGRGGAAGMHLISPFSLQKNTTIKV